MSTQKKFESGQRVFVAGSGIVEITGTETTDIHGFTTEFYLTKQDPELTLPSQIGIRSIPVKNAENAFLSLPSKKDFEKIIAIVSKPPRQSSKRAIRILKDLEAKLKSGNFFAIAEVYRDSVSADVDKQKRNEIPYSYARLKKQALDTLLIGYREVFGVTRLQAEQAFFPSDSQALETSSVTPDKSEAKDHPVSTSILPSKEKKVEAPLVLPDGFKNTSIYESIMGQPLSRVFRVNVNSTKSPKNDPVAQVEKMVRRSNGNLKTLSDLWQEIQNPNWDERASSYYKLDKMAAINVVNALKDKIDFLRRQLV